MCIEITKDARVVVRVPNRATKEQVNKFIFSHESWIEKHLRQAVIRKMQNPAPNEQELENLKIKAKEYLPKRVEELSKLTGLYPTGLKITGATTRFGSCSPKNSICLSYHLMRYPHKAIDYVIIHELCHTVHHNHQKSFWELVERFVPDYKACKQLLK